MSDMYKKIKKHNGEAFAQALRTYHNGLLEIPDLDKIVRHAGRNAAPLLSYLMSLLSANDDAPAPSPIQDPFVLLDQAGYNAFYADTLQKQNSIAQYFQQRELLCTFNDSARYENYHIVHAIKKDVDQIKRADFKNKEEREDAYGTSVISIQMLKRGGFISIKNRYNHTVSGCDNTFNSNPDNIIEGLSAALKEHFNVEFTASKNALPEDYAIFDAKIFHYHTEDNNIYYGDRAYAHDGVIHEVNTSAGDALFEDFLFDNASKTLKKIDPASNGIFADDFNRDYGGNHGLTVRNGNLMLGDDVLIGAEKSRIKSLYLPALTKMSDRCLYNAHTLTHFSAPALTTMDDGCLCHAPTLTQFIVPALITMGNICLQDARALTELSAPALTTMGNSCLYYAMALTDLTVPALITMSYDCFRHANNLTHFSAPALTTMGYRCLFDVPALTQFQAPALTTMDQRCLQDAKTLTHFIAPALKTMGDGCLQNTFELTHLTVPALTTIGSNCLRNISMLTQFSAPALTTMGHSCLNRAPALIQFITPVLTTMDEGCLYQVNALSQFSAPALTTMGNSCLREAAALTQFEAPALTTIGDICFSCVPALAQFSAPALTTTGHGCFYTARALTQFIAPALRKMDDDCLVRVSALVELKAPLLTPVPPHLKRFIKKRGAKPRAQGQRRL